MLYFSGDCGLSKRPALSVLEGGWMWLESAGISQFQGNLQFRQRCLGAYPLRIAWPEKK